MRNSPGVHFPPPLLFVAGFVGGVGLNAVWPLTLGSPPPEIGWFLVTVGTLVIATAMATFQRLGTAIFPNQPARRVVEVGPYRHSRNPMYVGLTTAYLGFVLVENTPWPLVLLPLVLGVLWFAVIRREERYLKEAFGDEYTDYCRRVRRWL